MPFEPAVTDTGAGRTLWVAAAGTSLVLAVFSAVVVTIADSARSLHAGTGGTAWALAAMSLGLAISLLTAGALADDLGHRCVLMWSAGLLFAASIAGALATTMAELVAARVAQGIGGGGVLAASLGSIGAAFPAGPARTHATALWGAAVGAGVAAGPLATGALAAAIGWRSGYWLEAVCAAAVMAGAATLSDGCARLTRSLDLRGIATLGAGMALLTAALVQARHSWTGPSAIGLSAAAAVFLVAFAVLEVRHRRPMLDPDLFASHQFLASIAGALFTGLAVIGLMSYSPALMQRALHVSVLGSAAVLAVWSATSMVVALAARSLPARLRTQNRLVVGLVLAAAGEAALTGLGSGASWTRLVPGLIVTGIGSGIANAALGRIAVESVPRDRAGMGSGANNTARYLGGAAGVALVVSIVSAGGKDGLIAGWNSAALVSAVLAALGAAIVASCRSWSTATWRGGSNDIATQRLRRRSTSRRA